VWLERLRQLFCLNLRAIEQECSWSPALHRRPTAPICNAACVIALSTDGAFLVVGYIRFIVCPCGEARTVACACA
jgi:hypothetical protein